MLVPYGSDYTGANAPGGFGLFTFQILNQDLNATTSAILYDALSSTTFKQKVSFYLTSKFGDHVTTQNILSLLTLLFSASFLFLFRLSVGCCGNNHHDSDARHLRREAVCV